MVDLYEQSHPMQLTLLRLQGGYDFTLFFVCLLTGLRRKFPFNFVNFGILWKLFFFTFCQKLINWFSQNSI